MTSHACRTPTIGCYRCELNADEVRHQLRDRIEEAGSLPVLADVADERSRQHARWGEQDHPDFDLQAVPALSRIVQRGRAQEVCEGRARAGTTTWECVLVEEVYEVLAELDDPRRLRAELIQVAAVAVAWAEAIDRRGRGR